MDNIIGLAGRKESGKTELAKICQKYGYEIFSFATPLKKMIANLLGITIDEVNALKKANKKYVLKEMDFLFLNNETGISIDVFREKCKDKEFNNTRELMQYIGTNIIREYNPNWHVDKTKEHILSSNFKNIIIDDVRFPNERNMIESLGGSCWFIVRPKFDNISNHISETALKWQEFDNVIINNTSLEYLKYKWNLLFEDDYNASLEKRKNVLYSLYGDKEKINKLIETEDNLTMLDIMFISKYIFTYDAKYRNNEHVKKVEQHGDFVNVYLDDDTIDVISNPLIIEDLKIYI